MQITRYDETLVDARAVNLTNSIGTVDIDVPVGFSCPTGSFRLSEPNNITFTHFTADVPSYGGERVFIITSLTAINSKVTEYYYTLDYLKDYAYRNQTSAGTISMPNTLVTSIYQQDSMNLIFHITPVNQVVSSLAELTTITEGNVVNNSYPYLVLNCADVDQGTWHDRAALISETLSNDILINSKTIYRFRECSLVDALNCELMKPQQTAQGQDTLNSLYCNISKAFYCPAVLNQAQSPEEHKTKPYIKPANDKIFYIDNTGRLEDFDLSGTELQGKTDFIQLPIANGIIEDERDTGLTLTIINANDLPPYKRYQIYIPYIGWYEIPINELTAGVGMSYMSQGCPIMIKYYFDLINGTVACRFGLRYNNIIAPTPTIVYSSYMTPYTPLPQMPTFTSTYASSAIAADNLYQSTLRNNAISSLYAISSNMASGNLGGTISAIGSMNVKKEQAAAAKEQTLLTADLGGFSSGRDSSIGQVDRQFKLITTIYKTQLTYDQAVKLFGYPINTLQDTLSLARTPGETENIKYWVDTASSYIPGPPDYANNVKAAYNQDYITYIVS